jgi:hypothetical protein
MLNTFDYLFNILDNYDSIIRDEILQYSYMDLSIEQHLGFIHKYDEFKSVILEHKSKYNEALFVHKMISESLAWAYHMGDIAEKQNTINRLKDMKEFIEKDRGDTLSGKEIIDHLTKSIDGMDEKFEKCNRWYNDFCEKVISKLLEEIFTLKSVTLEPIKVDARLITLE